MGRDEKIKVCHIISGDLWAGAEVQAYTLLKTLSEYPSVELMVIVFNEGKLAERLRQAGIETLVIDESKNGFSAILRKSRSYLDGKDVDIVHSHRRKENVLAGLLKRSRHTVCAVQTVHGAAEPFTGIKWLKDRIHSVLNGLVTERYFDLVIPVSNDLRALLSESLTRGQLTTVHNSIDLTTLVPSRSADEMRRTLNLPASQPVIGSAGRMVPVKGFDIYLEAAKEILKDMPQATFLLAGDGPLSEQLKQLAGRLGIEDRVRFLGFRNDITDILNCLDIFVVSSHHEGIPTVVLEAMALGKAVVATSVGGINEMIEPDVSGVLVKPGDFRTIAAACEKLAGDADLRRNLGGAARAAVEREFSSTVQAERVLDIYRRLLGRRGKVFG